MDKILSDDELEFHMIRQQSPQWNVTWKGEVYARVTERYIAAPTYVVTRVNKRQDAEEVALNDREAVCKQIVDWINA